MAETENLHLKKPAYGESADVKDFNDNMELIDSAVKSDRDEIQSIFAWKPAEDGEENQILRSKGDGTTKWGNAVTPEEIATEVTAWLDENIDQASTAAIDDTLLVEHAAAESKTVGDKFTAVGISIETANESVENGFEQLIGTKAFIFEPGYYKTPAVGSTVEKGTSINYVTTLIPVTEGDKVTLNATGYTGNSRLYVWINSDWKALNQVSTNLSGERTITAPANAVYLAINNRLASQAAGYYAYKGSKQTFVTFDGILNSSSNLDNIKKSCIVRWNAGSIPMNSPTPNAASMIVSGASTACTQTVINSSGYMWVRAYASSEWGEWQSVNTSKQGTIRAITPVVDSFYFDWSIGYTVSSEGNVTTNSKYALTALIPVYENTILYNTTTGTGKSGYTTNMMVIEYTAGVFQGRKSVSTGSRYTVPSNIDGIRIAYGYISNSAPAMSRTILDDYFSVKFMKAATPQDYTGDGERPYYVAFGASTTIGAVHHYSGEDITYSKYNYPVYIGKVLGLKAFNLAIGSTGLIERGDYGEPGYGTKNNIMDQIYTHDTILQKAGLVTLMFAYGNDRMVGEPQTAFPIGTYTDYYPYDEEGYHPSGAEGIVEMINKGATLFGCLNWCIKYLNEKYPKAQLVVIYGSPSANTNPRVITMTAQEEGVGVPPYVLTFGDFSENAVVRTIHNGLMELRTKLNVPIIDLYFEGNAFSSYSTYARESENGPYVLFSTKGTPENPEFNTHPNDEGYKRFARYLAGKVISLFDH